MRSKAVFCQQFVEIRRVGGCFQTEVVSAPDSLIKRLAPTVFVGASRLRKLARLGQAIVEAAGLFCGGGRLRRYGCSFECDRLGGLFGSFVGIQIERRGGFHILRFDMAIGIACTAERRFTEVAIAIIRARGFDRL